MIKNNTRIIVRNIFYESVNGKNPDISHIPRSTLSHISEDVYTDMASSFLIIFIWLILPIIRPH